jgi:transposase
MYVKNSNLSSYKIGQLITEWIYNAPAAVCARRIGVHPNTTHWWYNRIRKRIAALPDPSPFEGTVEIDETYLGRKRPGVIGTGMMDKIPVFGMKHRPSGSVWATPVAWTDHRILVPIICARIRPGSTIMSDGFGAYYHLKRFGYRHHVVNHQLTYVYHYRIHTNGIESFWAYMKKLFEPRCGIRRNRYDLHVREAVYRFNNRKEHNFRKLIMKLVLSSS